MSYNNKHQYYMPKQQYFYYNNLASKSAPHTKPQWTANQI